MQRPASFLPSSFWTLWILWTLLIRVGAAVSIPCSFEAALPCFPLTQWNFNTLGFGCHWPPVVPCHSSVDLAVGATSWSLGHDQSRRYGEADHPGPAFSITQINPTGLRGKENLIMGLPPGILSIAETHLAQQGLHATRRVFQSLANAAHRQIRFLPGAAVPLRPQSSTTGTWAGVLQVSDWPAHALTLPWANFEHSCGRIHVSKFVTSAFPIIGATIYAWSPGPTWPRARAHTQGLLHQLTQNLVLGSSGARFIAGDFNDASGQYDEVEIWLQLGWREVQTLRFQAAGEPPEATCKGATQPDKIYISPELALHFQGVTVHHCFADHGVVEAKFHVPNCQSHQLCWHMPVPLPWNGLDLQDWPRHARPPPALANCLDVTEHYHLLGKTYEDSCATALLQQRGFSLPSHCRGRGATLQPHTRPTQMPTLRPSRAGEIAPASSFVNRQLQHWFLQLRRVQSLVHNCRANHHHAAALEYRLTTWRAVLAAKGFGDSFAMWWQQRPVRLQSSVAWIPTLCPDLATLESLFDDLQANYRSMESWHLRNRQRALQLRYHECHKAAFSVVQSPKCPPLTALRRNETAEILTVDPQQSLVHVDRPFTDCAASHWYLDDCPAIVEKIDEQLYKVTSDLLLCPGQELEQRCHFAKTEEALQELATFWTPRWNRHADLPPDAWRRIIAFTEHFMPALPLQLPELSVASWDAINLRYHDHSAVGPDGFDQCDLRRMPICYKQSIVTLFRHIEDTGDWPCQLLQGHGIPLPKH